MVQLVDDSKGKTLCAASDLGRKGKKSTLTDAAKHVGELIAKKAAEQGVKSVVFDRGGYKYHGVIKALADGARKGGLIF